MIKLRVIGPRHGLVAAVALAICSSCALPQLAHAQYFQYSGYGDLLLGCRKTGTYQGNNELVVNLGNITNLLALAPGAIVTVTNFSPTQLSGAFSDYNNLQWSVSASFRSAAAWSGFAAYTIWYTLPRANPAVPTSPLARMSSGTQAAIKARIISVGDNANLLSQTLPTGSGNSTELVTEPVNNADDYSVQIADPIDASVGDFHGYLASADGTPYNAENLTPSSFSSPVVSDLYESVPAGYMDPYSGTNKGPAYYVGYFYLTPSGTMSFTRAPMSNSASLPPAPQIFSIARAGDTVSISFTTTNGTFSYALCYTNSAGLTAPLSQWPSSGTVLGDGTMKQLSDTSTDSDRFYRVRVQ